ncbi:MAG TPA: GNAT family N-acetyltransferase [Candidatus Saccharimonadia bacterium]|nr:GNAT family N-acetyltransferase [Candidatus Saccharimonadia bacterium]
MFIKELSTTDPTIQLVAPDVIRDAPLGVTWLAGPRGRHTLKMMGVMDSINQPSDLDQETKRIQVFLENPNQYNWMIRVKNQIVGSVWVDRHGWGNLKGPVVSIMIGDPSARGQGVGHAALQAAIEFLESQGHKRIYARHIIDNQVSPLLLSKLGFKKTGDPYIDDEDGLSWQTLVRS